MKLGATLESWGARFDSLSLRERALTACAALISLFMLWTLSVFDPIARQRDALLSEQASLAGLDEFGGTDVSRLLEQEAALRREMAQVDAQLAARSAGLIAPERMVQVIHEMLSHQRGVKLVSLHNKPVSSLAARAETNDVHAADTIDGETSDTALPAQEGGPYVHPVEIVIEGAYLDILAYLRALERLEWRFYWQMLELETQQHPTNRVRIELSTLSLEKDWIGV